MKKYYVIDAENGNVAAELYVGTDDEILPVWKSLYRHEFQHNINFNFDERPCIRPCRMYGLLWNYDDNSVWSVSADTVLRYIVSGDAINANI